MTDPVRSEHADGLALITLDDGKANAVNPVLLDGLNRALDAAEKEGLAVVLTGRPGRFSAGFDLSVLGQGGKTSRDLVGAGAELCVRLLEFPRPVVAACNGHAIAAGALIVLSCDFRIGARGAFKMGLNEVAIGMALPHFAHRIAGLRLSRRHIARAVVHAEMYDPEGAVDAGYLDVTIEPEGVLGEARAKAERLAQLDANAFRRTKRDLGGEVTRDIRDRLAEDLERLLPST